MPEAQLQVEKSLRGPASNVKKKQCCVLRKCQALANTKYLHPPPHCTTSSLTMDISLKTSPTISLSAIGRAVKQVQGDGNCFFLCNSCPNSWL